MVFADNNISELLSQSKSFLLEGSNIFASGEDDLRRIVCAAPNRSIAKAIHGPLEIAKKDQDLRGICGYITAALATRHTALTALVIMDDDTIFKGDTDVKFDGQCGTCVEAGTAGYDEFIDKFRKI